MVKKIVKTVCNLCGRCGCGMEITVEDGKAIKVQGDKNHPENHGTLCSKGHAVLEILYSPHRLKYPLKRIGKRGEGKWERISWDEALDLVAERLQLVKDNFGPEAVWFHKGAGHDVCAGDLRPYLQRLANVFGTPNASCPFYICYGPRVLNMFLLTGAIPAPDVENTNCILLWGINPSTTALTRHMKIQDALKQGTKLIVIDPRTTTLSKKATLHLKPRPGSDGPLALGLLKVIVEDNLFDAEFVSKWTIGFEELKVLLQEYSFEKLEKITWISRDEIRKAAHLYAKSDSACIFLGNALDQQINTSQAIRAITTLIAVSGNLDSAGGNVILSPGRLAKNTIELFDKLPQEADSKRLGNEFLLSRFEYTKMTHPPSAIKAILEETPYPVKALFIMAANPILTSPNSFRVKAALEKLDFLVVADIFMTKTAQLADIVLPACTFLEQTYYATYDAGADLKTTYPGLLMLRPQVVPPLEESRPDWQIIFDLAKKLGYGKYFPWRDIEEAIDYELKPTGITSRDLQDHPEGIMIRGPSFLYEKFGHKKIWGKLLIRFLSSTMFRKYPNMYHKYKRLGFTTPSKKVEILSHRLQEMGYDALPIYRESSGNPLSDPELAERYPLILTTGTKIRTYVHSQMRNIPSLHLRMPNNVVEVHPETAGLFGIDGEDTVLVETPQASIKCQAKFTHNIRPQVVQLYFGFEETNANLLTGTESFDPITGSVALRSLPCKIRKV